MKFRNRHMAARAVLVASTMALAGCAEVVADPARAAEHKAALVEIQAAAVEVGLQPGGIAKSCAMPFDCSANDYYESTNYIVDETLTDTIVCERFVLLADKLKYTMSWRDMHPEEGPGTPVQKVPDLLAGCIESLGANNGVGTNSQSEGVVFVGSVESGSAPVNYWVQLQSVVQPDGAPDGERGYYFLLNTME